MRKQTLAFFTISLLMISAACAPQPSLTLEEHAIQEIDWEGETPLFTPLESTRQEILAKHATQRNQPAIPGQPSLSFGSDQIEASETYSGKQVSISVSKNSQSILSVDAGVISPINNLRGMWQTDEHWYLEVAHVEEYPTDPNAAFIIWGEIFQDGESQNLEHGFDEAFNFQLLDGKAFYFFKKADKMGYVFNGNQYHLPYTHIPHYLCCSASAFNPLSSAEMVSFFAEKSVEKFYVEMGLFN